MSSELYNTGSSDVHNQTVAKQTGFLTQLHTQDNCVNTLIFRVQNTTAYDNYDDVVAYDDYDDVLVYDDYDDVVAYGDYDDVIAYDDYDVVVVVVVGSVVVLSIYVKLTS